MFQFKAVTVTLQRQQQEQQQKNINDINYLGCSYKPQTWNISPFFEEDTKNIISLSSTMFSLPRKRPTFKPFETLPRNQARLDRAVTTHHAHRLFDARQMSKSNDVHTLVFLRDSGMSVWKCRDFRVDVGKSKKITSDTGVMKYDMTPPPNFLQNYHVFALFDPPKWVIQWFLWKLRSFVCFVVVIVQGQGVKKNMGMSSKNNIIWAAGKTQYNWGALWDIGIVFRSSLCRFTMFGACTYDIVINESEI